MARIIEKVTHSHCSGLPLQADIEEKVFKTIFLDVGLMNAICGLNRHLVSQMTDIKLINEGAIAEQFIGQHLVSLLSDRQKQVSYPLISLPLYLVERLGAIIEGQLLSKNI
ncbi:DUF4143 domain-containing protein [uncultured Desulfobacter sp.]|uniref:DUF4143 domain-containing protein n=1 Tax=uncultured Desulfobacter sp. TaxID=240139 RepID=UPI0029F4DF24|nr:DUF4143 domain-containing protein [uncultured Desulfobacter sp.]